jgi:hypothetical protein
MNIFEIEKSALTIPIVIDTFEDIEMPAEIVLEGNTAKFSQERMVNAHARSLGGPRYLCGHSECKQPVYLKTSVNCRRFFSHFPGSKYCPWKEGETFTPPSEIYVGEQALHKFWKNKIWVALTRTSDVSNILVEHQENDYPEKRTPDISFTYKDQKFAIEVQMSWLKPDDIIARERFYDKRNWKVIWLMPSDKDSITKRDLLNNPLTAAYFCELDSSILEKWESDKSFSLAFSINNVQLSGPLGYLRDNYISETYQLVDCFESFDEDSGVSPVGEEGRQLNQGSISYIREQNTFCLLKTLACPKNRKPLVQTVQKQALNKYFIDGLGFKPPAKNIVRLIGSIVINQSLWQTSFNLEDILYSKLVDAPLKYGVYKPLAIAVALTYNPKLLKTELFKGILEEFYYGDFSEIEDPFDCIKSKDKLTVLALFPLLDKQWGEAILNEEIRCYNDGFE